MKKTAKILATLIISTLFIVTLAGCDTVTSSSSDNNNNNNENALIGRWLPTTSMNTTNRVSILFNQDGTGELAHSINFTWSTDNGLLTLNGFSDSHGIAGFGDTWNGVHYYRIVHSYSTHYGDRLTIWLDGETTPQMFLRLGSNQ